jgi:hypothetical protein
VASERREAGQRPPVVLGWRPALHTAAACPIPGSVAAPSARAASVHRDQGRATEMVDAPRPICSATTAAQRVRTGARLTRMGLGRVHGMRTVAASQSAATVHRRKWPPREGRIRPWEVAVKLSAGVSCSPVGPVILGPAPISPSPRVAVPRSPPDRRPFFGSALHRPSTYPTAPMIDRIP